MPSTRGAIVWKFFLGYMLTFGKATEPHCSKFPYEEALLEKMIRMEVRVEQMQESIKATETKVLDSLAALRQEREELARQFKSKATEQELLADKINANLKQNEDKLSRMSADLTTLQNVTMHKIIDTLVSEPVLFRARDVVDKSPTRNQIFVYPIIMENVGGGYNNNTGVFTAPQSGVYQFSVQLCSQDDLETNFAFVQDDVVKQLCQLENKGNSCGTSIMVTIMKAGSRVWIKGTYTLGKISLEGENSYKSNVFTGVLMK